MNYKVLYRKYRPQSFNDVTGQIFVVKTLKNEIANNKISHAYIFTGPRGTGKTSLAKIFAKSINCENPKDGNPCLKCSSCTEFKENPDIIEIDAASNNGVDEIRELINNIKLAPSNSKYKVYIIDEVHMLSQSAFNALLLTLEEPPSHVVFILATTDIQNVPITILSRTQRFDFSRISVDDIIKRLTFVCQKENINIENEAIKEIAILSEGGLRDALSILDQVSSQTTETITIDTVQNTFGTVSNIKIKSLIKYIEKNDIEEVLKILEEFKNSSIDSKVVINKIVNELKNMAINLKMGNIIEKRLDFKTIKSMISDLTDGFSKSIGIDPYIILQMIILDYMENIKTENQSPEIKNEKTENIQNITKNEEKEYFPGNILTENNTLKDIRVNNCFVNANKEDLKIIKELWKKFINKVKQIDSNIYMNISDTSIVAASDKYFICQTLSESSSGLFNNKVNQIESLFNNENNLDYKIVALCNDDWNKAKKEYINNKKNNVVYNYMKEEIETDNNSQDDSELASIVSNIFANSTVEIEKE